MKNKRLEQLIQHSLNTELSGLCTTSWQRNRYYENATGGKKVKLKMTYGLVLAIVLLLITITALAVTAALLTPKEIVEQVAVPLAQQNDKDWRVKTDFTPEELAAFIQKCNENGIDLDENDAIMKAFRNGEGYSEEEAIMAVCRKAFGGNYGEWTIAEQHWFQDVMVSIGWAEHNNVALPGPDDMTEEEARARLIAAIREKFGSDLPLEDKSQFETILSYFNESEIDTVWALTCRPRTEGAEAWYTAYLDKSGNVTEVRSVDYGRPQTLEEAGYVYTLTEEEAVHLAAEGIRSQTGRDIPLEDLEKYHSFVYKDTSPVGWNVSFISHTADWGRCVAFVEDATREVSVISMEIDEITADNILARYRNQHGWYSEWNTSVWAEITAKAADLPATTMEGRVVKATPWIDWREGLLTRDQAEEQAFRQTGVRMGDVNCACIIDADPHPIWKFRLLPWDESYQDSIVVEIDAVTGEMTDLDMYKSDYSELEPSYHMITLRRIWSRLEVEENGLLPVARLAVLHRFSDMGLDMPELYDLPIFDLRYWEPEIQGRVVRFRSRWSDLPDYEAEADENGMIVRVEEKESSGTEPLPEELNLESIDESMFEIDSRALADAQQTYGINDYTWPLDVQAKVFGNTGRTEPREGEMTQEEAVVFARKQLPPEAAEYVADSTVGVLCQRLDPGLPTEKLRWMITFMADPQVKDGWRVTFLDISNPDHEYSVNVNEPGDIGNG